MLRREYLNQTFQFLPEVAADYSSIVHDAAFEEEQRSLFLLQGTELTDEDTDEDSGMKNELFNDNLQINFLLIMMFSKKASKAILHKCLMPLFFLF